MSGLIVRAGEPLALHTPWRTGGPCDRFLVAHDEAAVFEAVSDCRGIDQRLTVQGASTRSIFRDGPMQGAVLRLGNDFATLQRPPDGGWMVGAAYPLAALCGAGALAGRSGLERFVCGAGSTGASLLLDEGWDELVSEVAVVRRNQTSWVSLTEARKKRPIVLYARLTLGTTDPEKVAARTLEHWQKQKPIPSSSWYDTPERKPLRALLRSVRLSMVRLRAVSIPEAAPEMIINQGGGTAADLLLLHRSAIERVERVLGIELHSRLKWLGSDEAAGETGALATTAGMSPTM